MSNANMTLDELPLQQLQMVRKQLEEEIQQLQLAQEQLKGAQERYQDAMDTVSVMQSTQNEKVVTLIPLTSSLFVKGYLASPTEGTPNDTVMVDVGTGYYAEKNLEEAKSFYQRKVDHVKSHAMKLTSTITTKLSNRQAVEVVMSEKMREARQEVEANA